MSDIEIRAVDPHDDDALASWHAAYFAGEVFGREDLATPWYLPEARAALRAELPDRWRGGWAGVVDGRVVTAGYLQTPLLDNLTLASVEVHTHPDHRNRGHGSAMLAFLEHEAVRRGRSLLTAEAAYPYHVAEGGAGHPSVEFLVRRGYTHALGDVQRALDLPVPAERLARLAAEAAPHHAAYALEPFEGPVPEKDVLGLAQLDASLMTEAPMGELELEPQTPDVAALRGAEAVMAESGRRKFTTVARHEGGELAGYTELVSTEHAPGEVYQWGTLVAPAHRGHRLGLALKVANLVFLQGLLPDARRVTTYNAAVNGHMIGVNEQLGFRPIERLGEFQKRM